MPIAIAKINLSIPVPLYHERPSSRIGRRLQVGNWHYDMPGLSLDATVSGHIR
jgi:hypothetical protein